MSSGDTNDPGSIWPGSVPPSWAQQSSEQAMAEGEIVYADEQQDKSHFASAPLFGAAEEYIADPEPEPAFVEDFAEPQDLRQRILYYVRLLLLPLLFGGTTALLTLPAIASGRAYIPAVLFWPMLVLIVILAVLQVFFVYYTTTIPHMWLLSTLGALAVFLLVGTFSVFGPLPGGILLLVIAGLVVYMVRRILHPVPEGYVDIVFVQGKYKRTLTSGFNLLLPWERVLEQVNIGEIHWLCQPQRVQLSPTEDVIVRALISYQIVPEDAHLAVTDIKNWEDSLRQEFETTLQTVATAFTPDDFLSWPQSLHSYHAQRQFADGDFTGTPERREQLNHEIYSRLYDRWADRGVMINWVRLRNVELAPHGFPSVADISDYTGDPVPANGGPEKADKHDEPTVILRVDDIVAPVSPANTSQEGIPTPPPATPVAPQMPVLELKEEVLKKAYDQVKEGRITDPTLIRTIAASFEAVAQNQEINQNVTFDAARAAQNLYRQAEEYEEKQRSGSFHNEKTRELSTPDGSHG